MALSVTKLADSANGITLGISGATGKVNIYRHFNKYVDAESWRVAYQGGGFATDTTAGGKTMVTGWNNETFTDESVSVAEVANREGLQGYYYYVIDEATLESLKSSGEIENHNALPNDAYAYVGIALSSILEYEAAKDPTALLGASYAAAYAQALNSSGQGARSVTLENRTEDRNVCIVVFESDVNNPITDAIITEKFVDTGVSYFQRLFQNDVPKVDGYDTNVQLNVKYTYKKR